MKIPKKIKIGGMVYTVHRNVERLSFGDDAMGEIHYIANTIELSSQIYGTPREEQTLIHEIIHAILKEYGYDEQDEGIVERLSSGIYALLQDNDIK